MVTDKDLFVSYPDSSYKKARIAISKNLGRGIGPENIILTNGTIELIKLFCEVFTRDEAIIPTPTFCEYERFSAINDANMIFLKYGEMIDNGVLESIKGRIEHERGTVFICNPNNPTGDLIEKDDLFLLSEFLDENNHMLFIDEAFIDFAPHETSLELVQEMKNVVIGRSLTKIIGIPGIRLGYGIASEDIISIIKKAQIPWSVNNIARGIAESIGEFDSFIRSSVDVLGSERDRMLNELSKIDGMNIRPSSTNYLMLHIDGVPSSEISEKMKGLGILVRRCDSFRGGDDISIRVAVRNSKENDALIEAFKRLYG